MPESASIIEPLLHRKIVVTADKVTISGILLGCDASGHGGLGNLILRNSKGKIIVRGDQVQNVIFSY